MNPRKKIIAQSVFICVAATLVACGGGGSDTKSDVSDRPFVPTPAPPLPNDPQVPPPVTSPQSYVIEYYGDSTVWGWASSTSGAQVATPAPVAFANALADATRYQVSNEGVSGTTACELLEGDYGSYPAWSTQMQISQATHVIINHGINDEDAYTVARYRGCLQDLVQIARSNDKAVILETPNPVGDPNLTQYVEAMREVAAAQAVPLIDQHAYLTTVLNGSPVGSDGVHPSQEVYILKGEYAATRFLEIYPN